MRLLGGGTQAFEHQSFYKCTSKGKAAQLQCVIPDDPERACQIQYDRSTVDSQAEMGMKAWRWASKT